jgi:hypothetical protein
VILVIVGPPKLIAMPLPGPSTYYGILKSILDSDAGQGPGRFCIGGIEASKIVVHNLSTFGGGIMVLRNPSLGQCGHPNTCMTGKTPIFSAVHTEGVDTPHRILEFRFELA